MLDLICLIKADRKQNKKLAFLLRTFNIGFKIYKLKMKIKLNPLSNNISFRISLCPLTPEIIISGVKNESSKNFDDH